MLREITWRQVLAKQLRFMDHWCGTPAPDKLAFIEVGSLENFVRGHLPRAMHLYPELLALDREKQLRLYLPHPGVEIILYGQNALDPLVHAAVQRLEQLGFHNLFTLQGGKAIWKFESLTLETRIVPADTGVAEQFQPSRRAA